MVGPILASLRPRRARASAAAAAAIACVLAAAVAGCGSSGGRLTVLAATSLTRAFTSYGQSLRGSSPRLAFAGSDMLAAQIREGVHADVFASANVQLPEALYAARLVRRPTIFAANRLVLAVPAGSRGVRSLADLRRPGVRIAIGSATVPVGAYTRTALGRLPATEERAIMRNVRTEEPDVGGIVGKLTQRAADAGFLYVTDVRAAGGALRAIELPPALRPRVAYAVAVIASSAHMAAATAFIAGLLHGAGRRALLAAGFEAPGG